MYHLIKLEDKEHFIILINRLVRNTCIIHYIVISCITEITQIICTEIHGNTQLFWQAHYMQLQLFKLKTPLILTVIHHTLVWLKMFTYSYLTSQFTLLPPVLTGDLLLITKYVGNTSNIVSMLRQNKIFYSTEHRTIPIWSLPLIVSIFWLVIYP